MDVVAGSTRSTSVIVETNFCRELTSADLLLERLEELVPVIAAARG